MAETLGKSARKGVAWTTLGSLGNYGVHFVFNIILARLLSPEDFGICFMPVLFYTIAHICVEGGFSSALVREREVTEVDLNTAFWYRMVMSLLFYGLLFLASPYIAAFYETPVLTDIIKVSGLSLIIVPMGMVPNIRFMRQLDFRTPALLGIAGAFMSGVSGVALALHGWGLWAIVWSGLMTDVFNQLLIAFVSPWWPRLQWSQRSLRRMMGFGSKMQASQLLNTVNDNLVPIFIGKIYAGYQLGLYMRARNWASIPSSGLTGIVGKVIFPLFARLQDNRVQLGNAFLRISRVTAFVIFPLMMGIVAISDPMVRVLLTDKWAGCVPFNRLLCFSMMWYPIHSINLQILISLGYSGRFLRLEILKTIILWASLLLFHYGIIWYLVCNAILSPVLWWLNSRYTHELVGVSMLQQIRNLFPVLLFALGLSGVMWCVTLAFENLWLQFIAGVGIGVLFYFVVGRLCYASELAEVIRVLRRHR